MVNVTETTEPGNFLIKKIELAFGEPGLEAREKFKGQEEWIIRQAAGKVHLIPPDRDKHQMLAINTNDQELHSIFNEAAAIVTRKWNGFNQIGPGQKAGLTAWELWKRPDISEA